MWFRHGEWYNRPDHACRMSLSRALYELIHNSSQGDNYVSIERMAIIPADTLPAERVPKIKD